MDNSLNLFVVFKEVGDHAVFRVLSIKKGLKILQIEKGFIFWTLHSIVSKAILL